MKVIELDPEYPETWLVRPAVEALSAGGVVVLPTDSIYALACDPWDRQAVSRLYQTKRMDKSKRCSVMCGDLKEVGEVARAVPLEAFRFMRTHLPGAYTILLHASRDLPRQATGGRKSIGVRIPDHPVSLAILEGFGRPILVSSLPTWEEGTLLDPVSACVHLARQPDLVVDQGPKQAEASTVVDFTTSPPELVRQGKGEVMLLPD